MSTSKTEEPTPRRMREARQRGEVPKSRELVAATSLFAALFLLSWATPRFVASFPALFAASLGGEPFPAALVAVAPALGVIVGVALFSAAVVFASVGPLFSLKVVSPDASRLDPIKGGKRLFSKDRLVDMARHLLMLALALLVAAALLRDEARAVVSLVRAAPARALGSLGELLFALALRVGAVLSLFAVVDVFLKRMRHQKSLRMSREEVRREHRETEGDPQSKQARARAHREAVEHGLLESVRSASVLVVNPTHYAVALRFDVDSEQEAPEVVAKGVDSLARRMIEVAREAGVPVVRDVSLARALHELELGEEIPEVFYQAVAAILEVAAAEREER